MTDTKKDLAEIQELHQEHTDRLVEGLRYAADGNELGAAISLANAEVVLEDMQAAVDRLPDANK